MNTTSLQIMSLTNENVQWIDLVILKLSRYGNMMVYRRYARGNQLATWIETSTGIFLIICIFFCMHIAFLNLLGSFFATRALMTILPCINTNLTLLCRYANKALCQNLSKVFYLKYLSIAVITTMIEKRFVSYFYYYWVRKHHICQSHVLHIAIRNSNVILL